MIIHAYNYCIVFDIPDFRTDSAAGSKMMLIVIGP
jgi:hypothetical protein